MQFNSPSTSPTISGPVLVGRKIEPIPTVVPVPVPSPSKKDGVFGSSTKTRKESSPPVLSGMLSSGSQSKKVVILIIKL